MGKQWNKMQRISCRRKRSESIGPRIMATGVAGLTGLVPAAVFIDIDGIFAEVQAI